jgi:hypothetical protein
MTAPICRACSSDAVVQWQRRPTEAEFSDLLATENARREMLTMLADPANPPDFGALPTVGSTLLTVPACAVHAIGLELAAHIHGASCTAPPACNCAPEVIPPSDSGAGPVGAVMPPGWVT